MTFSLRSYAKLNLYLGVLKKRKDGYHDIETVFERIDLSDTISFSPSQDGLVHFRCDDPGLPVDAGNLCVKAAGALRSRFKIKEGCRISLRKRIPYGSGLGGGSSNAACVLKGLCRLWRLRASRGRLEALAASIGSDVPFFLADTSFARGQGRGERVTPVPAGKTRFFHVVAVPGVCVPTRRIYAAWDRAARRRPGLTKPAGDVTMILQAIKNRDPGSLGGAVFNSLEPVTKELYPVVGAIIEKLSRCPGVTAVLMSGSGSAVFGVFATLGDAAAAVSMLESPKCRVFLVKTI